ncbi:MAG: hypothetical protein ACUVQ9_11130 [Thermodesulfobacteriota bacterium]
MIGIATPYGEVYLKGDNKKTCEGEMCCEMGSTCRMNSSCNGKATNPQGSFCPLCPSLYSFNPYLPNGGEIFFIPPVFSLIIIPLETIRDQGYVASVFRPPTSIL